jgi:hypothetical protein
MGQLSFNIVDINRHEPRAAPEVSDGYPFPEAFGEVVTASSLCSSP